MSYRLLPSSLLALAGLGLMAGQAAAADLDPAYGIIPPLQQERVEFGTGWYVRGDMAAEQDYVLALYQPPNSQYTAYGFRRSHAPGYDFSLGGGYAFTDRIRVDVTADIHQPTTFGSSSYCYNATTTTCYLSGTMRNYDALINAYYDIGKWGSITPYVGGGVGVGFGEIKNTLTGLASNFGGNVGYHTFAFALMAGVAIDVFDHTKLDIGYRYLNDGRFQGAAMYYHQIRAGLRYMIDN